MYKLSKYIIANAVFLLLLSFFINCQGQPRQKNEIKGVLVYSDSLQPVKNGTIFLLRISKDAKGGIHAEFTAEEINKTGQIKTNEKGEFDFKNVKPGNYSIFTIGHGQSPFEPLRTLQKIPVEIVYKENAPLLDLGKVLLIQ